MILYGCQPYSNYAFVSDMSRVSSGTRKSYLSKSYLNSEVEYNQKMDVAMPIVETNINVPPPMVDMGMESTMVNTQEMTYVKDTYELLEMAPSINVQGGSLRTCSLDSSVERVQLCLNTEGRPLTANVELWQGPDNMPQKMGIYLEDGCSRPFSAMMEFHGSSNSVAVRNTGTIEFPFTAYIEPTRRINRIPSASPIDAFMSISEPVVVQGGAVHTSTYPPAVMALQIAMRTEGRPLNARLELLQGPNNNKQVMELYSEDGGLRPFFFIVETPGSGNVVRVVNTAALEFPLYAHIEPFAIDPDYDIYTGSPLGDASGGLTWS